MNTGVYRGADDFKTPQIDDHHSKLDDYSEQVGKLIKIHDIISKGNQMLKNRIEIARNDLMQL